MALQQAYEAMVGLIEGLKSLGRSIKKYTGELLAVKEPRDILGHIFAQYFSEVLGERYYRLKISKHISKYRTGIIARGEGVAVKPAGETITGRFNEITRDGDDYLENVQTLTDYRSYLDFDIIITDNLNHRSYFSKVARDKSGGKTRIPFYVAILTSFYRVYQLYRKNDTLRLVVFDGVFNRADADRVEEAIIFMKNLGFQAVVVAPTGRIQLIVPYMNINLIVMPDGFNSFIERVSRKQDAISGSR